MPIDLPKGGRRAWFPPTSPFAANGASGLVKGEAGSPGLSPRESGGTNSFVVGVCGGTAAGKTTVCTKIIESLGVRWVLVISMDNFYKGFELEEGQTVSSYNFDHPDAFDLDLLAETLRKLKRGEPADIPFYDFVTHSRIPSKTTRVYGADVILFEGIFAFYSEELREICDLKIFTEEDDDIRLLRRLRRDVAERGRDVPGVIDQYLRFVKPAYDNYIVPLMKYADIVFPRAGRNDVAIDLVTKYINRKLAASGFDIKSLTCGSSEDDALCKSDSVSLLQQRPQLLGMHTIMRDHRTRRRDFIDAADRISRLLIEHALDSLSYEEVTVETPMGEPYTGLRLCSPVCAVSVIRAGEAMESAITEVCGPIPIGKILIQSVEKQPYLFFAQLCKDISTRTVLLLDATLGTGASALMAIRVLLDYGVKEDHIVFVTLIASKPGVGNLLRAHPKIRIVASAIDDNLLPQSAHISPGVGNFGDRYF